MSENFRFEGRQISQRLHHLIRVSMLLKHCIVGENTYRGADYIIKNLTILSAISFYS